MDLRCMLNLVRPTAPRLGLYPMPGLYAIVSVHRVRVAVESEMQLSSGGTVGILSCES